MSVKVVDLNTEAVEEQPTLEPIEEVKEEAPEPVVDVVNEVIEEANEPPKEEVKEDVKPKRQTQKDRIKCPKCLKDVSLKDIQIFTRKKTAVVSCQRNQ